MQLLDNAEFPILIKIFSTFMIEIDSSRFSLKNYSHFIFSLLVSVVNLEKVQHMIFLFVCFQTFWTVHSIFKIEVIALNLEVPHLRM